MLEYQSPAVMNPDQKPEPAVAQTAPFPTERRTLTRLFVISPKGLADQRWERISKRLAEYAPALPPLERISVNKNLFNFADVRLREHLFDDRKWSVRRGMRFKPPPEAENFEREYGHYFSGTDPCMNKIFPGELACSVAHIKAWEAIGDGDDLCLVLEDDTDLLPGLDPSAVEWPSGAGVLHLYPSMVNHCGPGDGRFKPMLTEKDLPDPSNWPTDLHNMVTSGYIISREGARALLNNLLPMKFNEPIDLAMFDRSIKDLRAYVRLSAQIELVPSVSLVRVDGLLQKLVALLQGSAIRPMFSFLWHAICPTWLKLRLVQRISR